MAELFCFACSLLLSVAFFPFATSLSFSFNFTGSDGVRIPQGLELEGDASATTEGIQLTKNLTGEDGYYSTGRALSTNLLHLWDSTSGNLTSFTTHFSFKISKYPNRSYGDGLAFFLAPSSERLIPSNSVGENLGLFNNSANQVLAVEFDSYHNYFDLPQGDHVGIDVYSIKSIAVAELFNFSISNGSNTAHATVKYDGGAMNLSVLLSYSSEDPSVDGRSWNVSSAIDLKKYLPEEVVVGFSAATGQSVESHTILSWDFNSTELPTSGSPAPALAQEIIIIHTNRTRLLLGIVIGLAIILCVLGLLSWHILWRRRRRGSTATSAELLPAVVDREWGLRSFAYQDLVDATNNFADERKLGEGGFGVVYRGVLPGTNNLQVAIKKISRESMQGEKEYMAEVTLFSQLHHRNLVKLIGYCHEAEDFLLIYQYMPNRSLDKHLYNSDRFLGWAERYKIAVGLASALFYLHEEWEQCVVHRDVKPSNVMLDEEFNAKLGDFGLARLVDHNCTGVTTVLAGTKGYIAPEYGKTGKARKASDVFSFGVVVLEIACGRKPNIDVEEPERKNLVEWMWGLYKKGACLEAADRRLGNEFDERLMERLMVLGLWCAHPDYKLRPSIRRAVGVLSFDTPLPDLQPLNMARQEISCEASSSSGGPSSNSISCSSYGPR